MADRMLRGSAATAPALIDLGLIGATPSSDVDVSRSGYRPSPWIPALVVVGVAAALLTAGGPAPPVPRHVMAVERAFDSAMIDGDAVYAYVGGSDGPAVTAYGLDGGAVRWRYGPVRRTSIMPAESVTLLSPAGCSSIQSFTTVAVDRHTGQARWQQAGVPVLRVGGGGLMVFKQPVNSCAEASLGADPTPSIPFVWAGVSLSGGTVEWSLQVDAGVRLAVGYDAGDAARWLAVADHGLITAYDLRTGRPLGSTQAAADPVVALRTRLLPAGDQALLMRRDATGLRLAAHDVSGFALRWTTTVAPPANLVRLDLDSYAALRCGPLICLGPPTETVGLDAATGRELWRVPGRPVRTGSAYAVFARQPRGSDPPELVVHDLATGRVQTRLTGWEPLGVAGRDALLAAPAGDGSRLWRVRLDTGEVVPVAVLPRPYGECELAGGYLVCRTVLGELDGWRLPPGRAG